MKNFDKIIIGLILGCAFPIFFSLVALIIWFYFDMNENHALFYVVVGFLLGLIIDFQFLKRWINRRFELPIWLIIGIYVFYNVGMFGFFMGFPVFNLFWGLIAGYYMGQRTHYSNIATTQHPKIINRVSLFTAFIMTFICISSGWIALAGNGVGKDLQMMFGLNFEVTKTMIIAIALTGGTLLISTQYYLTKMTMERTINFANKIQ